ncbi:MAG: hypothetical protein N2560_04110 [Ignavibacteria bacterium]|nr:hypothetical protein [Ignavibacteria bacterium]
MEKQFFDRQEMEERMPDYIFGRLSKEEMEKFENSLLNFPDLVQEIEDVRKVFSKLEKANIDKFVEKRTRNIPVKVNERLKQRRSPLNILARPGFVTLVAGLGIILIAISIFFPIARKFDVNPTQVVKKADTLDNNPLIFPQLDELANLANEQQLDLNILPEIVSAIPLEQDNSYEPAVDFLDELVSEQIVDFIVNEKSVGFTPPYFDLFKNLDKIDENNFQKLIEELKDVQI